MADELPNRRAVLATLVSLSVDPEINADAALALTLADQLDAGAGMATAAIARELRATLKDLRAEKAGDESIHALMSELSSIVDDASH